jgi:uncharacterized phage protein (TIGR01671 family)
MRKLKFRAWVRCGEWDDDGERQAFEMVLPDDLAFEEYATLNDILNGSNDESVFMQFTGLADCQGKEIYEGDILLAKSRYVVKWVDVNAGFDGCHFRSSRLNLSPCGWNQAEIIGNIYENEDLLGRKSDKGERK